MVCSIGESVRGVVISESQYSCEPAYTIAVLPLTRYEGCWLSCDRTFGAGVDRSRFDLLRAASVKRLCRISSVCGCSNFATEFKVDDWNRTVGARSRHSGRADEQKVAGTQRWLKKSSVCFASNDLPLSIALLRSQQTLSLAKPNLPRGGSGGGAIRVRCRASKIRSFRVRLCVSFCGCLGAVEWIRAVATCVVFCVWQCRVWSRDFCIGRRE